MAAPKLTKQMAVRLTEGEWRDLERIARKEDRAPSTHVRHLIREAIRKDRALR